MKLPTPTPTRDPLPYLRNGEPSGTPTASGLSMRGEAIAAFDALLHEINPDAIRVDADRLQHLMQWLLALPDDAARDVLDARLCRIEQLRAMIGDPDWDTNDATRLRVVKLLDYVDLQDDLIADRQPLVGLLDDIVLLELAWPVFAAEIAEYDDFCAYRDQQHPIGSGQQQRAAWIRDRLAEIALSRHQQQVSGGHFAAPGQSESVFRVR